jgi:hypothetical protein
VRLLAALVLAVLVVVLAACGGGDEASRSAEQTTDTTTTRPEVVPPTAGPISGVPTGLTGTEIDVRGDLYGTVSDAAGNAMGVPDPSTGIQLTRIPGGSFLSAGDDDGGQYFLRDDGVYEGAWTVDEDDEVVFIVRNHADDEITETAATLPFVVRAGDKLSLELGAPSDLASLELAVDETGDGSPDRTVPFGDPVVGAGASDRFQPVSRVTVERVEGGAGKRVARVMITVNERGGAGVARIEYALDASGKTGVYTAPIEVPAVGKIVVRAIDRAGNIEAPYPRVSLSPKPSGG